MGERAIGEIFRHDKVYLKTVGNPAWAMCRNCYFKNPKGGCMRNLQVVGMCLGRFRSDGTCVHFEEVL